MAPSTARLTEERSVSGDDIFLGDDEFRTKLDVDNHHLGVFAANTFTPIAPLSVQIAGRFNPLTYIVDAERALFSGTFADRSVPLAILAALITCAIGLWIGVRQVAKSTT